MVAVIDEYGGLSRITEFLEKFSCTQILLVTGKKSFTACGAEAVLEKALKDYNVTRFSDFEINPRLEDGIKGAGIAKEINADVILSVGGGSPMDIAKLIKAFLPDISKAEALVRGKVPVSYSEIPLLMVPSTAGSGSEATHFAVAYIGKEKFSLASEFLLPNAYILDGKLLQSAPAYQRAINGLDALAQATEGAWAAKSSEQTRALSYAAIEALVNFLPKIVHSNDPESLQASMRAANQAGQVINVTKTTAPHAFSYAFTSYHGVSHGHAVWMTLPAVFEQHLAAKPEAISDPRGPEHLKGVMRRLVDLYRLSSSQSAEDGLKSFMTSLGVEPEMIKMGDLDKEERTRLSKLVNRERMANNPVELGEMDVRKIFKI